MVLKLYCVSYHTQIINSKYSKMTTLSISALHSCLGHTWEHRNISKEVLKRSSSSSLGLQKQWAATHFFIPLSSLVSMQRTPKQMFLFFFFIFFSSPDRQLGVICHLVKSQTRIRKHGWQRESTQKYLAKIKTLKTQGDITLDGCYGEFQSGKANIHPEVDTGGFSTLVKHKDGPGSLNK